MTTVIIIGLIVIALIAAKRYKKKSSAQKNNSSTEPSTVDKTIADSAVDFGYKCMWFAVKTGNRNRPAEILKLKNISDCNWQVGIGMAYNGSVFVTPAINGWTLVCGWGLPHGDTKESIAEVKSILQTLSDEFEEAQFYSNHRVTGFTCWIKATNGNIDRVYSFAGESGENIVVEGEPTAFEKTLNLGNSFSPEAKDPEYHERMDIVWPDEEILMKVANSWSVDPTQLEKRTDISSGLGLLGQR